MGIALIFADILSYDSRTNYDLRCKFEFNRPLVKLVFNGTETILYSCLSIWDLVPQEKPQKESLTAFKKVIKTWNLHSSLYRKISCWHQIYLNYDFLGLLNFSTTPYIEGSSHMETSQLICNANQLMSFCGVQSF